MTEKQTAIKALTVQVDKACAFIEQQGRALEAADALASMCQDCPVDFEAVRKHPKASGMKHACLRGNARRRNALEAYRAARAALRR